MLNKIDSEIIHFIRHFSQSISRLAIFVVFFWFGLLKVLGVSPANEIVELLLVETLPAFPFSVFIIVLGLAEMIIGILFIIPKAERIAILFLFLHMITTFLPLVFLPQIVWQGFLVPTLEGQYIIKNLVILALALGIASHLHPHKTH